MEMQYCAKFTDLLAMAKSHLLLLDFRWIESFYLIELYLGIEYVELASAEDSYTIIAYLKQEKCYQPTHKNIVYLSYLTFYFGVFLLRSEC